MMADCSDLQNSVPSIPPNELKGVECSSVTFEYKAECSASDKTVTSAHGVSSDVHILSREANRASDWKDVTRTETYPAELEKNVLPAELEDSIEYIDSDAGNPVEAGPQFMCDKGIENKVLTIGGLNSMNLHCKNSVFLSERSNVGLEVLNSTSNALLEVVPVGLIGSSVRPQKDVEEFVCGKESLSTAASSESNSASVGEVFKVGEFTTPLITGLGVLIPASHVPAESSRLDLVPDQTTYISSSHATSPQHDQQSVSSLKNAQSVIHNTTSGNCETMQTDSTPPHPDVHQETPESMKQSSLASNGGADNTVKNTAEVISTLEQTVCVKKPTADNISSTLPKAKKTPNDFIFGKVIGEGSYSTVYLAKEVSTQKEFAIKVCDKKHLIRERKTHFVMREKEVLMKLDHPFFIRLAYTFQDPERLYYVLTYARNGELLGYLHKLSAFDVPCSRFYSAEIILALEYLHGLGIIHRDLKPENILLSEDMHIKITDFGTSKILSVDSNVSTDKKDEQQKRKNSFVGTAEYVSPEVLNNQPANYGSDLWALGCIVYQCLSGSLPFRSGNEYQTFQKIIKTEYDFPEGFHPAAKDLVQKLLMLEPTARLGMVPPEGMNALKKHAFYEGVDWERLPESTPPTLMPYLPATATSPEFWGQDHRVGFDDQRLAEIITGQNIEGSPELLEVAVRVPSQAEDAERAEKLKKQRLENPFHQFVEGNLIIKQGFVDKRKGLFARKRMLLLTEGPHLYYVDAHNKVLKGEIPWSKYLRPEAKNFKIFFVHTPNRTYYLESRQPDAQDWIKQIKDVWMKYYCNDKEKVAK